MNARILVQLTLLVSVVSPLFCSGVQVAAKIQSVESDTCSPEKVRHTKRAIQVSLTEVPAGKGAGVRVAPHLHNLNLLIDTDTPKKVLNRAIRVNLTDAAVKKGAVCLDGSPAAYHYYPGTGTGFNNWMVYHQGGAWCYDVESCANRAKTYLGSTSMEATDSMEQSWFSGQMSQNPQDNPDFHNWNLVYVRYCDGASFSGDVDQPVEVSPGGPIIYFRGQRIWEAVIADLLQNRGMHQAEKAVLAGCSAGGLTTIIHCDQFRAIMPATTFVKCLSNAGFFLDQKNVEGVYFLRNNFSSVVALQNLTANLHPNCIAERSAAQLWQCFFPQYFIQYLKTPIYILNSAYDSWQISNSLIPYQDWSGKNSSWKICYTNLNFSSCSKDQLALILDFRNGMVSFISRVMTGFIEKSGAFIFSCRIHCIGTQNWNNGGIHINQVTPAKAFGDWYFERHQSATPRVQIDVAVPTNSSCGR